MKSSEKMWIMETRLNGVTYTMVITDEQVMVSQGERYLGKFTNKWDAATSILKSVELPKPCIKNVDLDCGDPDALMLISTEWAHYVIGKPDKDGKCVLADNRYTEDDHWMYSTWDIKDVWEHITWLDALAALLDGLTRTEVK